MRKGSIIGSLIERWTEVQEGLGEKKYGLADLAKLAVAGVSALILWRYGRAMTPLEIFATSSTVVFALLWWVAIERSLKLRKQLTPLVHAAYDDRAKDCHKAVLHSADGGVTSYNGRSIRLRITCGSDVQVEHCSGFLTKVEYREHGGSFSEIPLYEPAYLHWAMEEPTPFAPVTVYPRIPRHLGICRTDEKHDGFSIRLRHRSFVTPETFNKIGEYRFHIEIVGARSPALSCILLITWNGKWNEVAARLESS